MQFNLEKEVQKVFDISIQLLINHGQLSPKVFLNIVEKVHFVLTNEYYRGGVRW